MIRPEEVIKVGRLQKPYGIRGEISILFDKPVYADIDTEFYFLDIDHILVPFHVEEITYISDTVARVKFEDLDDESRASRYANLQVFLLRKQVEEGLEDGSADWDFFIGYRIVDQHEQDLGIIESVDFATINVLFIVKGEEGEHLIPASEDFIVRIDERQRIIHMDLPEGLIGVG